MKGQLHTRVQDSISNDKFAKLATYTYVFHFDGANSRSMQRPFFQHIFNRDGLAYISFRVPTEQSVLFCFNTVYRSARGIVAFHALSGTWPTHPRATTIDHDFPTRIYLTDISTSCIRDNRVFPKKMRAAAAARLTAAICR